MSGTERTSMSDNSRMKSKVEKAENNGTGVNLNRKRKAEEGGGDKGDHEGGNNQKKPFRSTQINSLVGSKGFLITCDRGRERQAAKQADQIVQECLNAVKPAKQVLETSSVQAAIAAELKAANADGGRLRCIELEQKKGFFIGVLENENQVDPVTISSWVIKDIQKTRKSKSTACARLLPLQRIAHSSIDSIKEAIEDMLTAFIGGKKSQTISYAVKFRRRFSEKPKREEVINGIGKVIDSVGLLKTTQVDFVVDLTKPDLTIQVEVYKSVAGLSLIEDMYTYSDFNLRKSV